ncbi:MAG: Trm112 family protein [Planctomycetota bacterium]
MAFDFEKCRHYLQCPRSRSPLVRDGEWLVCTNPDVRLRYPILEEIPRLLVDEAEELTPEAWQAVMQRVATR